MAKLNLIQTLNQTLQQQLAKDKNIILLGEDVGKDGGVFRVTDGLWKEFGNNRVIDTPLSEIGIIATSVGLAIAGMKPIAEVQFDGFSMPMLDQLYHHAARMRKRSQGKYHVPLVLRVPHGGGIRGLEHHSESLETFFAHIPGLKVVTPSTPYNAKGLLIAAINDPDPVIFLEPKRVYRAIKQEVPEKEYTIPLGKTEVIQSGNDVTVISWGAMQKVVRSAIKQLQNKYSIDILDILTLSPLDKQPIFESVKKTGRCVVVQEAPKTCGYGAELAAIIGEDVLLSLKAPVTRVTGYDIPVPLPKLENYYIPNEEKIINAIESVMSF
ncbi:alpha-ketoacid dehydrogenase subunit beta [Patescibacteria group bacterium AH-259-L05]|nr:alpha-ketoacid dehydrogenase subunit beta [Patescibacteria group bacterium AH-259-L05]